MNKKKLMIMILIQNIFQQKRNKIKKKLIKNKI